MEFNRSKKLYERAKQVIPGGISSNVRANWEPFPLFYVRGKGSRVWDADGNEFIDYVLGRGPLLLGHSPKPVIEAVKAQMDRGLFFAGQTELEVEAAESICAMVPCAEQVRFGSSGSEAVHAALRLARAATGRNKILRFEGHYHGWFDNIAWNFCPPVEKSGFCEGTDLTVSSLGQPEEEGANLFALPWNDLDAVERLFTERGSEIAAVIMEPVMCNFGAISPQPGYLEGVRECCDRNGSLLIFDEVITGFRLSLGGAQEKFRVTPDLATFAKALGGGFIVSALAGKEKFMKPFGELTTVHAGTYNAYPPSMAGILAALKMLSENKGALLEQAKTTANTLMEGIRNLTSQSSLPLTVRGTAPVFHLSFVPENAEPVVDYRTALQTDAALTQTFWIELQQRGIRVTPEGLWFVSTAHTQDDIDKTLEAVKDALAELEKKVV